MANNYPFGFLVAKLGGVLAAPLLISAAAYAQAFHLLAFGGVNPNLAPVALLPLSFFESRIPIWLVAFVVMCVFLFSSFWRFEFLWLLLALTITLSIKIFFLWQDFSRLLLGVAVFTMLTFVFFPRPHFWQSADLLILELFLNCFWGGLFFFLFSILLKRSTRHYVYI